MKTLYKYTYFFQVCLFSLFLIPYSLFWTGCNTVQFVPEGKYLIKKDVKIKGNEEVKSDKIEEAMRVHQNRRMLMGPKTFLYLYNLGKIIEYDSTLLKKILLKRQSIREYYYPLIVKTLTEEIGEAPEILNIDDIKRDSINIRNLYFSYGFFYPQIHYKIDTLDNIFQYQKVKIQVDIVEGEAYKIGYLQYNITDSTVKRLYFEEIDKSKMVVGNNYNHDDMGAERTRIANQMRDKGFFNFSPGMVAFVVDTLNYFPAPAGYDTSQMFLKINLNIEERPIQFHIGEVKDSLVTAFFDDRNQDDYFAPFRTDSIPPDIRAIIPPHRLGDTTLHLTFKVSERLLREINFDFIGERIKIKEGELYSRTKAQQTQRDLQRLTMFQYVNMTYHPDTLTKKIDVKITNKLSPRFGEKIGGEIFTNVVNDQSNLNSGLNINMGINGSLINRNTFFHSEQSEFSLAGLVGFYRPRTGADSGQIKLLYEARTKVSIDFPRFITPYTPFNRKNYSMLDPKTSVLGSIRVESRREYKRITVGGNFSYRWNHIPYKTLSSSQLTPLALDIISVPQSSLASDFLKVLNRSPQLLRDFKPRFSSRTLYSYTHSDYMTVRTKPTHFWKGSFEEAGTIPFLIDHLLKYTKNDTTPIADQSLYFAKENPIFYARYFKLTGEGKYYFPLWKTGEVVVRGLIGGSYKLKNTLELPLQNRFYSGGTNSMRGWQSNLLGPGLTPQDSNRIVARGGEYSLEMNAEFRFKVYSFVNMAVFTDFGNTWYAYKPKLEAVYPDLMRMVLVKPKGSPNRYENLQLGWDAGLGLRFDFTFLIFRIDVAQQLYLPQFKNYLWNIKFEKDTGRLYRNLNIGLGYPF